MNLLMYMCSMKDYSHCPFHFLSLSCIYFMALSIDGVGVVVIHALLFDFHYSVPPFLALRRAYLVPRALRLAGTAAASSSARGLALLALAWEDDATAVFLVFFVF